MHPGDVHLGEMCSVFHNLRLCTAIARAYSWRQGEIRNPSDASVPDAFVTLP
jgi:hypothetical protein